ncbi:hypothetical_protein [Candidozyma auris]|uniref:hypothetical_protein n=1 Tax=Candidozyma auris TaxID=498019 RepID=UPI000D2BCE10|nr:hypothetical_protein [[Candida] auris]QEO21904.1 hypothetical_protein [[Candida] auris]GBL51684.1 hypothetical protein CAJCM15448_39580 [[Candida] auris]
MPQGSLQSDPASSPPWYKRAQPDSDNDEFNPDASVTHEFLAGVSTPLHVNSGKTVMMISPMKRLDRLHISHNDHSQLKGSDEDKDVDSGDLAANQTILTDYSSEESVTDDGEQRLPPIFVRKRKHDTSSDMILTPAFDTGRIRDTDASAKSMSISSNITNDSLSKISFSSSYSTPCPSQPRKKLKFKDDVTPSQPSKIKRPLLNLSCSKKVSAGSEPLIDKLNNAGNDNSSSFTDDSVSPGREANPKHESTPISQSTPANSRAPSPFTEDTSESLNGFSFAKPQQDIHFKYETPQARSTATYSSHKPSQQLKNAYNNGDFAGVTGGKYEILGKFPVSAAGLMDEDDSDLHVGDKRINDPYLQAPSSELSDYDDGDRERVRSEYLGSTEKLPLLLHFECELSKEEMLELIQDSTSVSAFYEYICEPKSLKSLLKKERLRWHPDKWNTRYKTSKFDEEIIRSLSQVINSLIENS